MKDVFPSKTSEFINFVERFVNGVGEATDDYDFSPEEIAEMQEELSGLASAERDLAEIRLQARAQKARRDTLIETARKNYRRRIRLARASQKSNDARLANIGLKTPDTEPSPLITPTEAPILMVFNETRLRHTLKFWEHGSARRRRKPEGVIGAEIWRKIIGVDENLVLIGIATRSPHSIKYKAEDIGKQVEYEIAWLTRRGERSDASQTVSATVTG